MVRIPTATVPAALMIGMLCMTSPPQASAGPEELVLGQYTYFSNHGFFGVATSVTHVTYLSPLPAAFEGDGMLFEDIVLTDGYNDVIEVTDADDPDFETYVQLLTDGQDWYLYDTLYYSDGSMLANYGLESERLPVDKKPPPDDDSPIAGDYPDLYGATITRVVRELSLAMQTPGSDPNGDGIWTDVQIEVITTIYGVPAPSALGLLTVAMIMGRRRRN